MSPALDVKGEEVNEPSCSSVHWSGTLDGEYCVHSFRCYSKKKAI